MEKGIGKRERKRGGKKRVATPRLLALLFLLLLSLSFSISLATTTTKRSRWDRPPPLLKADENVSILIGWSPGYLRGQIRLGRQLESSSSPGRGMFGFGVVVGERREKKRRWREKEEEREREKKRKKKDRKPPAARKEGSSFQCFRFFLFLFSLLTRGGFRQPFSLLTVVQ